jgi:8-oxo-dGTP pyrophosphatase MutT (NUDIX family)
MPPDRGVKLPEQRFAATRPRDAASIILIDRSSGTPKILMGKRGAGHVFMPGVYVFPGGRRDRYDHTLPFTGDLDPMVHSGLRKRVTRPLGAGGARALALAALRELHEETGLRASSSTTHVPDLSRLRFVARAITPPGHIRRYDTRFFCAFTDEAGVDPGALHDTDELVDVSWLDTDALCSLNMAQITRSILEDVTKLMIVDPALSFENAVPFYFMRHGLAVREHL